MCRHVCVMWVCVCKCWGVGGVVHGMVTCLGTVYALGGVVCICVYGVGMCQCGVWYLSLGCFCVCVCVCAHALLFSLARGPGASPSRATCPLRGFSQGEGQQHIRSRQRVGGEVWEPKRFSCESLSVQAASETTEFPQSSQLGPSHPCTVLR